MTKLTYSRQQLYELIWSAPLGQVAAKLETTSALIRKICFDENIPVPGYFYWSPSNADRRKLDPLPLKEHEMILNFPDVVERSQTDLLAPGEMLSKLKAPQRLADPDPLTIQPARNTR